MKMNINMTVAGLGLLAVLGWTGCANDYRAPGPAAGKTMADRPGAVAILEPTQGHTARGTVTFTPTATGVRVVADLVNLKPGEHGFHIHEKGDCSAPDATSAGGHYNPTGVPHGAPDAPQHHVGDLGNILADDTGRAHLDREFNFLQLHGPHSIIGRGLIVHADRDDLVSQPTGNAGARVACGVIRAH